jgi:uncharacterized membrane protein
MKFDLNNPRTLSMTAIMTALVMGLTLAHVSPTPVGGYIHLGDIAVYFASFAFGPWVGLVSGGLGAALADVIGGGAAFAPLSLVVHGLQGFVAGWIAGQNPTTRRMILALLVGSLILVVGYFAGEALFYVGAGEALLEIPWNIVQEVVGALGAVVYLAVARSYPRLRQSS